MVKSSIWFDMDGVLSEYNHSDYIGHNPKYLESHYFASRPVNPLMRDLITKVIKYDSVLQPNHNTGIISKVQPSVSKFIEESKDKTAWVHKNISNPYDPQLKSPSLKLLFTGHNESKAETVKTFLQRPLTKADVLIDDYNPNLEDWVNHGGTAIKYGLGDKESWSSYYFDDNLTVDEMFEFLAIITNYRYNITYYH